MSNDSQSGDEKNVTVDVIDVDEIAPPSIDDAASNLKSLTGPKKVSNTESILERLANEYGDFTSLIGAKLSCYADLSAAPKPPVVRKRGRPRKHFPPPSDPPSNGPDVIPPGKNTSLSLKQGDKTKNANNCIKKRRKRKVKGYPWGQVKKKKKISVNVSFMYLL